MQQYFFLLCEGLIGLSFKGSLPVLPDVLLLAVFELQVYFPEWGHTRGYLSVSMGSSGTLKNSYVVLSLVLKVFLSRILMCLLKDWITDWFVSTAICHWLCKATSRLQHQVTFDKWKSKNIPLVWRERETTEEMFMYLKIVQKIKVIIILDKNMIIFFLKNNSHVQGDQ